MRRREFITLLGGAAAWPLAARWRGAAGRACRQVYRRDHADRFGASGTAVHKLRRHALLDRPDLI